MIKLLQDKYTITSYNADVTKHASIVALCNFMQESAWKHAEIMGVGFHDLMEMNQAWVLSRLSVDFTAFPAWQEEVSLQTWPRGKHRLFALRDFLITDAALEKQYTAATSSWLIIDLDSRKPQRLDHLDTKLWGIPDKNATAENAGKVGFIEKGFDTARFRVKYSDLDVNRHVNNVAYIKWMIDALPMDFLERNVISHLTVNFVSEALQNDEVVLRFSSKPETDKPLFISADEANTGRELCRVAFRFKDRLTTDFSAPV